MPTAFFHLSIMETLQYIEHPSSNQEPFQMKPLDGTELYVFMGFMVFTILGLWFLIVKSLLDSLKK